MVKFCFLNNSLISLVVSNNYRAENTVYVKASNRGRQSCWYTSDQTGDLIGLTIKNDTRSKTDTT